MKVQGDFTFDAPAGEVWKALLDPTVLASIMPGCKKLEQTGEGQYEGDLEVKVGPVQGKFQGSVRLSDIDEPKGYTIHVDGKGSQGFVKATSRVTLEGDGARTRMEYDADAQVGGRIASVGQRLVEASAKAIIRQSLDGLNQVVASWSANGSATAGEEGAAAASPPPQISQARFAAGVAREVTKELIPAPLRVPLVLGAVVVVIVVAYLLLR